MNPGKPSLLLITVDCLRADHCGFHGYTRPTTPFLDSLASESFVVSTAMVAGAPTYYSLPAILASRMPLALGRDIVGLAPGEHTLATTLRRAGYATAAFTAANPYISPRFGYAQGFDLFRDFLDFSVPTNESSTQAQAGKENFLSSLNRWLKKSADTLHLSSIYNEMYFRYCLRIARPKDPSIDVLRKFPAADIAVDAAQSWIATLGAQPFFLWLHLMDPHSPYYPPVAAFQELIGTQLSSSRARYLNEFWNRSDLPVSRLRTQKQAVTDLYDAGIRWVDTQIARLAASLKGSHLWDNCVFAFTADHGEEFLEHGRRYHAPISLREEIAHVPLLIRVPAQSVPGTSAPAAPVKAESVPAELKPGQPLPAQTSPAVRTVPATAVFSHLHLAPTLLSILNVSPPASFQGKSLWSRLRANSKTHDAANYDTTNHSSATSDPSLAIAECVYDCKNPFSAESLLSPKLLSVRDARYKLIIRLEPGAVEEIYDLTSDPMENNPLLAGAITAATREVRRRLLRAALEHVSQTIAARPANLRLRACLRNLRLKLDA